MLKSPNHPGHECHIRLIPWKNKHLTMQARWTHVGRPRSTNDQCMQYSRRAACCLAHVSTPPHTPPLQRGVDRHPTHARTQATAQTQTGRSLDLRLLPTFKNRCLNHWRIEVGLLRGVWDWHGCAVPSLTIRGWPGGGEPLQRRDDKALP